MPTIADLLAALKQKDFVSAHKAFASVMQEKVNQRLMDEKKSLVTEAKSASDDEEPSDKKQDSADYDKSDRAIAKGTYNNIANTVKKLAKEAAEDEGEPDEEDITTTDHQNFYYLRKKIASSPSEAKAWMKKNNYFPTVWFVSDHGNAHVTDLK
jgi:type I site-specific restriction endonuclease